MQKLHFTIQINAPKETVWNTMLSDQTYRQWTSPFSPGSHYVGSWEEGSKILFLDADKQDGMVSTIARNKLHEFISIKHIGVVHKGVEDTSNTEDWTGALENYAFKQSEGITTLIVDMDTTDPYVDEFNKMWPQALQKLKQICERQTS